MECMRLIFDLSCSIPCGWVADKCVWNCSLQISVDLISLWRQRLEEDLAGGEKTVRKCLIMFGMHRYLWSCIPSKRKFWRPNAFKGQRGSHHLAVPLSTRKLIIVFFPVLWILSSHSRAHSQRWQGPVKQHFNYVWFMWTYYSNENIRVAEHEPQVFKWQFMFEEGKGPGSHV